MTPSRLVGFVGEPKAVQALAHPLRIRILESLRGAESAAGVARAIGAGRQNVNYHMRELERAGLVRGAGERRTGNFIEQLYEPVAHTLLVSPRLAWGTERRAALQDQVSLEQLIELGERIQTDAAGLLDRATFDGLEVSSASVVAEVRFAGPDERSAFMTQYLEALGPLLRKYGAVDGAPYRVALTVYPEPEEED
jgi:DNA-binding transcriptional ArsR family regulator